MKWFRSLMLFLMVLLFSSNAYSATSGTVYFTDGESIKFESTDFPPIRIEYQNSITALPLSRIAKISVDDCAIYKNPNTGQKSCRTELSIVTKTGVRTHAKRTNWTFFRGTAVNPLSGEFKKQHWPFLNQKTGEQSIEKIEFD